MHVKMPIYHHRVKPNLQILKNMYINYKEDLGYPILSILKRHLFTENIVL